MPTKQREPKESSGGDRALLHSVIAKQVMLRLGQPDGLLSVQVRPLWLSYYRVNVFVGTDGASAKVAQSYFLSADGDGNILTASPEITKRY